MKNFYIFLIFILFLISYTSNQQTGACCCRTECSITVSTNCTGETCVFKGAGILCNPNPCIKKKGFDSCCCNCNNN